MKKLFLLLTLFALPSFAGFKIISDDGTVTNLTGIVDSAGDYYANGVLDSANARNAEGILDWDGASTYSYHPSGIYISALDGYRISGIVDSYGFYHETGIYDGSNSGNQYGYYQEGILDFDGFSTSTFHDEGIFFLDEYDYTLKYASEGVMIYNPYSGTYNYNYVTAGIIYNPGFGQYAFTTGAGILYHDPMDYLWKRETKGILAFDGATHTYHNQGILEYDSNNLTYIHHVDGILYYLPIYGSYRYAATGLFLYCSYEGTRKYYEQDRGVVSNDGASYGYNFTLASGMVFFNPDSNLYEFRSQGILARNPESFQIEYNPEGILDWDGFLTYTYQATGIFDGAGHFGIDSAVSTITGGLVNASTIGTYTGTDNLTSDILKVGKTVGDVVGAAPSGGGGNGVSWRINGM
jgi:hypothetical protein